MSAGVVRVLGIDPGTSVTGWGVVESAGGTFRCVASGALDPGAVAVNCCV